MDSSDAIARLLDQQALTQLAARYAQAVDWLDPVQMKDCFEEGAKVRFGTIELDAHAFCDMWTEMGGGFKARHHLLGIPVIRLDGAQQARVEAPAMVAGTRHDAGARMRDFLECNRYLFTARKARDAWKFTGAQIFITWSQGAPTPTATEAGAAQDHDVDRKHPAYGGSTGG